MDKKTIGIIVAIVLIVSGLYFYFSFTIFVIQPIGAIPEGRTLIINRLNKMNFIDSADGFCERNTGGVSLFGRMAVLAGC